MKKVTSTSDILNLKETWQKFNQECDKLRSELACYNKDLRFLQQLLDRYFDEIVQNENLDEIRESLIRFQDLCYNCGRLKKRVKDQQNKLIEMINGSPGHDPSTIKKEQSWIEKRKASLMKDFKVVKNEILIIADNVIQINKDNNDLVFHS